MNIPARILAALMVLVAAFALSANTPAAARGGAAANIMSSPGYQRALEESRKRYRESATQPRVQPSAVHKRKKSRHHSPRD
ncbi:hypothetical protein [Afipia birgiae]|jgi:hypothetical protein|uniref:hypothetical protein n=1 Tax=Afipia birgiae TaxID=151414 RepID=UPI0002F84003|nr:hypothetical protein [Afipia birgiae]MBX9822300.1 hypothetical protein [Afipia birgiae]